MNGLEQKLSKRDIIDLVDNIISLNNEIRELTLATIEMSYFEVEQAKRVLNIKMLEIKAINRKLKKNEEDKR